MENARTIIMIVFICPLAVTLAISLYYFCFTILRDIIKGDF